MVLMSRSSGQLLVEASRPRDRRIADCHSTDRSTSPFDDANEGWSMAAGQVRSSRLGLLGPDAPGRELVDH